MPVRIKRKFYLSIGMVALALVLLSQLDYLDVLLGRFFCEAANIVYLDHQRETLAARLTNILLGFSYLAISYVCTQKRRGKILFLSFAQIIAISALLAAPFFSHIASFISPGLYLAFALIGVSLGLAKNVVQDIEETGQVQQVEAKLRTRELLETRLQMIRQDELERKMLAADLHDQVLNDLKLMKKSMVESDHATGNELTARLDGAMDSIRQVMESLCPSDLEHIGLIAALEECLNDRAEKGDFIPQFRSSVTEEDILSLTKIDKALIYRIVQESLTNIAKHAQAKRVRLTVQQELSELHIRVIDDGIGMTKSANEKSRGLQYMKLRADIVNARLCWSGNVDGTGTTFEIRVNLTKGAPDIEN